MKIKKDAELICDCDWWYDLTDGGYIKPEKILEDPKDIEKVLAAIKIVREFQEAYDDACDEFEEGA